MEFMHTKVTVPFKIGYTNAELVDDNSVKTDKSDSTIFISKSDSVKTGKDLKIKLLSSKKEIKNGKIYGNSSLVAKIKEGNLTVTKPDSIYISSDDSFIESASLNGVEFNPYEGTSLLPILDVNNSNGSLSFNTITPKDGKYTVKAKLISGVEKSCTYYIDTKKPVVKVKAGKLSISDKKKDGYASGIKSITVDGKVSKNGASVKKGSKVVVKDKAGNVTKLTVK